MHSILIIGIKNYTFDICNQWRSRGEGGAWEQLPGLTKPLPPPLAPRKFPDCFRNNTAITLFKPAVEVKLIQSPQALLLRSWPHHITDPSILALKP